jgi:TetR/AcrR family transcriptional regulator, transcriptional repressor for nem operon
MPKHSHKEQLLTQGLRVVHARGFGGASVRDIVRAAGVPQGSFTNHFASKEAFGLAVLERYFEQTRLAMAQTLLNDAMAPTKRLRAYMDLSNRVQCAGELRNGCLIGNLSIEASDHSEVIRTRLVEIFAEMKQAVAYCLRAGVKAGELSTSTECDALADFFILSLQGAMLRAKVERSAAPFKIFEKFFLSTLSLPSKE